MSSINMEEETQKNQAGCDVECDARRLAELQDIVERATVEINEIKQRLFLSCGFGSHVAGPWRVQVRRGARRLNAVKFVKRFPATDFPEYYTVKPLAASALVPLIRGDVLEEFMIGNAPTVTLK